MVMARLKACPSTEKEESESREKVERAEVISLLEKVIESDEASPLLAKNARNGAPNARLLEKRIERETRIPLLAKNARNGAPGLYQKVKQISISAVSKRRSGICRRRRRVI